MFTLTGPEIIPIPTLYIENNELLNSIIDTTISIKSQTIIINLYITSTDRYLKHYMINKMNEDVKAN
jgi:hypothetical protein